MRVRSESALEPLGLRARHLIALTVLRDHGPSTQQALSTTLQIDRTNLVGLLNELEAGELISRRRSSEDRRRHIVELTDTGAHRLAEAEFTLAAAEDDVLNALDHQQREALYHLLQQATTETGLTCAGEEPDTGSDP
jgi:MarR family transcriptional regulator, lower aerobic nicotinate degradation pathway regulator